VELEGHGQEIGGAVGPPLQKAAVSEYRAISQKTQSRDEKFQEGWASR